MRKVLLAVVFMFCSVLSLSAEADVDSLATATSILATAADTTAAWSIQYGEYFAIQVKAPGDSADLKIQYQLSYDGKNEWGYEAGADATDPLIANLTSSSWAIYSLSPMVSHYLRFIITGNAGNGGDGTTYSLIAMKWGSR